MRGAFNWFFRSDQFDHRLIVVPEPSTLLLFSLSAVALAAVTLTGSRRTS
jgi:hypothetical protein